MSHGNNKVTIIVQSFPLLYQKKSNFGKANTNFMTWNNSIASVTK